MKFSLPLIHENEWSANYEEFPFYAKVVPFAGAVIGAG